ncbi:MAG: PBP1A family penicillin-binding protein [Deltaproteobacteria bacterium]|nr:PBP1A family penicillin-binding protein [Deltaproteobacteria bacterium]
MLRFFTALVILLFILSLLSLGGFIWIDQRVEARLRPWDTDSSSAIYSAPLHLRAGAKISPELLRRELSNRGYREVSALPVTPGEFLVAGTLFEINTPPFRSPFGNQPEPNYLVYDCSAGTAHSGSDPEASDLILTPRRISYLGFAKQREHEELRLADFPQHLIDAVITVEDHRFFEHHGIDFQGIARAAVANLRALAIVQGGSTLTQQLAKNMLFSPKKTIGRKIMEALAAISLESRLSKEEILESYLNEIYLGQEGAAAIHGFAAASRLFFGKKIGEISLSESALLTGIIRAPSYYSPRRHLTRATKRRNTVLKQLLQAGKINAAEFRQAKNEPLRILPGSERSPSTAFFQVALQKQLEQRLNLDAAIPAGIKVYSGLDAGMQNCAQQAVVAGLNRLKRDFAKSVRADLEAGLVAIEPYSGLVRAWIGGRDYSRNQFDHVSQAKRQIGSTVKPFIYLAALDRGGGGHATPATILYDQPFEIKLTGNKVWRPENIDKKYRGPVTLRYALEKSLNIPTAALAQEVGIDVAAATIERFGVAAKVPRVPAITLGAVDTDLLSLTSAYAALANGGFYVEPRLFTAVWDNQDEELLTSKIVEKRISDESATYILTNILQGVIERGTGQAARRSGFSRPAAGKTGTSDKARDAWFVGFTPTLAAGVWVGYDNNAKLGLTGSTAAAPIWSEFMKCAEPYYQASDFIPPSGVVFTELDSQSGALVTRSCPPQNIVREVFIRGTEPKNYCPLHPHEELPEAILPHSTPTPARKRSRGLWEIIFGE